MSVRRCSRCAQLALRIPVCIESGAMLAVYCGHCGKRQRVVGTLRFSCGYQGVA